MNWAVVPIAVGCVVGFALLIGLFHWLGEILIDTGLPIGLVVPLTVGLSLAIPLAIILGLLVP